MDRNLIAIGLISGTSADGIDAVLVRTDGAGKPELLAFCENPYPSEVRQEVLDLYSPGPNEIDRMGSLDKKLGELFAKAALAVCSKAGMSPSEVDVIGSHGQTIRHRPPDFTLQIGNPAIISARTGIKTVADFRQADMAQDGQGAPLAPLFHQVLFASSSESVGVLNLGGIANLTALSPTGELLVAGDTGPASSLLDLLVAKIHDGQEAEHLFDAGGEGAAGGEVDSLALSWLLTHPYFSQPFPKSTGREVFGSDFLEEFLSIFPYLVNQDGLATLTMLTAETVAMACRELLVHPSYRLVLCGGGEKNLTLVGMLREILPAAKIVSSQELGVDSNSLESQFFAWFAVRTLKGLTSSVPEATGAKKAAVLGAIIS
jgi:anhydro-N-acetylmuramic acid kinase